MLILTEFDRILISMRIYLPECKYWVECTMPIAMISILVTMMLCSLLLYFEHGCEMCTFFRWTNCQQHKAWETSVKLLFARLDLESISTLNSEPNIETKYVS